MFQDLALTFLELCLSLLILVDVPSVDSTVKTTCNKEILATGIMMSNQWTQCYIMYNNINNLWYSMFFTQLEWPLKVLVLVFRFLLRWGV